MRWRRCAGNKRRTGAAIEHGAPVLRRLAAAGRLLLQPAWAEAGPAPAIDGQARLTLAHDPFDGLHAEPGAAANGLRRAEGEHGWRTGPGRPPQWQLRLTQGADTWLAGLSWAHPGDVADDGRLQLAGAQVQAQAHDAARGGSGRSLMIRSEWSR